MTKQYRALVGLNYTPVGGKEEKRVEIGGDCSDVPPKDIDSLLAMNPPAIEAYQADDKASSDAEKQESAAKPAESKSK